MSDVDLPGLLADASLAGAYHVEPGARASVVEAARLLGHEFAAIDLVGCTDKAQVLQRFAGALDFPDWFGGNWDALADCLDDLSWRPADGYVLWLEHAQAWRDADEAGFATLVELADGVAASWAQDGVPFWLLLPLPAGG